MTEPDPVVVLFAKWGTLQDEAITLEKADPEGEDSALDDQREELALRQNGIEEQVIATAATSAGGIAVKLRLMRANTAFLDGHEFGDMLIGSTIESAEHLAGEARP